MKKQEYKDNYYEDRINLYDYIQIIWRWKFIIVGIVILSVIVALLMSFRITPVYRVSTSLSPGANEELNEETMKVELEPVDSIKNIISYINGGIYNQKIFKSLNLDPFGLQFHAEQPGEEYHINVYYDTTDPAHGKVIVGELLNQIEKSYSWKISLKINRVKMILNEIVFCIDRIKLLKTAENNIIKQMKGFDDNTKSIMEQRNLFLGEGGKGDSVVLLLYSNIIHNNIAYRNILNTTLQMNRMDLGTQQREFETLENTLSNEFLISEKLITKINIADEFSEFLSKYDHLLEERPSLKRFLEKFKNAEIEEEASDVKMIRVGQEPFVSSKPIKPKRARMVMISVVLSLFLGFFLALIIDFIKKNKASSNQG